MDVTETTLRERGKAIESAFKDISQSRASNDLLRESRDAAERFSLWAGNLRLYKEDSSSLDHVLQASAPKDTESTTTKSSIDSSSIIRLVFAILEGLEQNLNQSGYELKHHGS